MNIIGQNEELRKKEKEKSRNTEEWEEQEN